MGKPTKRHRSSVTGKTVTKGYADKNPATTVAEKIKRRPVGLIDATNWARALLAMTAVRQIQPDGEHIKAFDHEVVLGYLERWMLALGPIIVRGR